MMNVKALWARFINNPKVANALDNTHVQVVTIFALFVLMWVFIFAFPETSAIVMALLLLGSIYAMLYYMIKEFKNSGGD